MRVRLNLGGYEIALRPGESLIGRTRACHLRVDDPTVSRRHARLLVVRDVCTIADLGSRNGVKINGAKITDARQLANGDVVAVGACVFTVHIHNEDVEDSAEYEAQQVEDVTQIPDESPYQVPVYRTCINCRGLLKKGDAECPHCGSEQTQQYSTIQLWVDPQGRRTAYRAAVRMRALYVSAFMTIDGEVSDISLGGAFFSTQLFDQVGTACDLLIFPSDDGEVVRFSAEVVRTSQSEGSLGLGIRFLRMTSSAQSWLLTVAQPPRD
jgi:RNA polymerase subunit RPABC4/transcription elongation factor Spt4